MTSLRASYTDSHSLACRRYAQPFGPCFILTGHGDLITTNMELPMEEQASKAYLHMKMMCSHLPPHRRHDLSMDLTSPDVDIHVNHIVGTKFHTIGLATAAGLLALMVGKTVDPKACFIGVSILALYQIACHGDDDGW